MWRSKVWSIRQRVAAGAALLDDRWPLFVSPDAPPAWAGKSPDWRSLIDLGKLDLNSPTECVLGQLFGDYTVGLKKLILYGGTWSGFSLLTTGDESELKLLHAAWRVAIKTRP